MTRFIGREWPGVVNRAIAYAHGYQAAMTYIRDQQEPYCD